MGNKEYKWVGNGTVNIRGKLYGNGPIPTGGLEQKVLDRLVERGDLEEVKASNKEPEKKEEPAPAPAPLPEVKKVKKYSKKGKR